MTSTPDITVVVCSHNGERTIAACLEALANLNGRERVQVVVVDDGSSDATGAIADASGCEVLHLVPNRGLSAARNAGIAAARAPFIAFTDDDCVPPPTWTNQLLATWSQVGDDVVCIGGVVTAADTDSVNRRYVKWRQPLRPIPLDIASGASFAHRLVRYARGPAHFRHDDGVQAVASVVGANMSYRASALAAVGGFNPTRTFSGDETWVSRQLRDTFGAHSVCCDPDIEMRHDFHRSFRDSLRRSYAYGIGSGRDALLRTEAITLQPLAGLVALSLVALPVFWPLPVALAVVAPWVLHRSARHELSQHVSALLFPYMVLAEEACNNAGWLVGVWRTRRTQRARR